MLGPECFSQIYTDNAFKCTCDGQGSDVIIMSGVAAGFSGVFGTPIAGKPIQVVTEVPLPLLYQFKYLRLNVHVCRYGVCFGGQPSGVHRFPSLHPLPSGLRNLRHLWPVDSGGVGQRAPGMQSQLSPVAHHFAILSQPLFPHHFCCSCFIFSVVSSLLLLLLLLFSTGVVGVRANVLQHELWWPLQRYHDPTGVAQCLPNLFCCLLLCFLPSPHPYILYVQYNKYNKYIKICENLSLTLHCPHFSCRFSQWG